MALKLNTGSKTALEIEFEDKGESFFLYFNPADPDLASRINRFKDEVPKKIKDLKDIELNPDGTPNGESFIKEYEKAMQILKDEIDYIFQGEVSKDIFKYCSPLAIIDGKYFIVSFMEAITPELIKHIKKAGQKVEKSMRKYTAKYGIE